MLLTIFTIVFLLGYAVLIVFYDAVWQKIKTFNGADLKPTVFISVIVAARNEEQTLPQLLHSLSAQEYPPALFEVIIVNDFSTDQTSSVARSFLNENFRTILPEGDAKDSSKKNAIASGVKKAKGKLIVVTDADCTMGPKWLSTIAQFYAATDASFIAAPVKFEHNNSFLQIFQALDFISLQGITAASVMSRFHNMCNGANLAYKKKSYLDVNGFSGIDKVATGDDMLLMHKIAKKEPENIYYLKSKDVIVSTQPMQTWKDFFMQRKRWASKTFVYNDWKIIMVLVLVYLFNLLFFVLLVAAFQNSLYWIHLAICFFGKTLIEWPFVYSVAKFYNEQKLMRYFILFGPLHIFYTVFVGLFSQLGKYEWKGRKLR